MAVNREANREAHQPGFIFSISGKIQSLQGPWTLSTEKLI